MCSRDVQCGWSVVMHTLCERYLLLYGWIVNMRIMPGKDVC